MDAHLFSNLVSYSAQIAAIAAGGTLLLLLLRVHSPSIRYLWWRGLLALCVVLPWIQARRPLPVVPAKPVSFEVIDAPVAAATAAPASSTIDWMLVATVVLIAGATARLIWMAASLFRLRRLRTAGEPAAIAPADEELQETLGTRAEIRYVPHLGQPVTFGLRRPVVLLPEVLRTCAPAIRRAVLCHELVHVRRRDWAWVVGEELVRAVLWFHPAAWWIVSRAQLAREESVDQIAVRVTRSRRAYVEALLAFADGPRLAAAPAFLRKRHLFRRILLISKETVMSPRRIAVSCLVMVCAAVGGSWYVVQAFPLTEPGWQSPDSATDGVADGAAVESQMPQLVSFVMPAYPEEPKESGIAAVVTIRMTVDAGGRVAEARSEGMYFSSATRPAHEVEASSLSPFSSTAQEAVRKWIYEPPPGAPVVVYAQFEFDPWRPTRVLAHGTSRPARSGIVRGVVAAPAPAPPALAGRGSNREPLAPGTGQANAGAPNVRDIVFEGNAPSASAARAPAGAAPQTTRPTAPIQGPAGQVTKPAPTPPPPAPPKPVRVGGNLTAPKKIKDVKPIYPKEAQEAAVQGIVILEAVIDEKGKIQSARVIRSVPLLDEAALDAVKQWEFTPTLLNGVPTPIIMSVTVNFQLSAPRPAQGSAGAASPPSTPIRIGGNITAPTKIKDMAPVYPAIAVAARVSGIVILELTIDADGRVSNARVIRSVPLLDQAALDAVKQWQYTPTLLNGVPTPVVMSVTVPFTIPER